MGSTQWLNLDRIIHSFVRPGGDNIYIEVWDRTGYSTMSLMAFLTLSMLLITGQVVVPVRSYRIAEKDYPAYKVPGLVPAYSLVEVGPGALYSPGQANMLEQQVWLDPALHTLPHHHQQWYQDQEDADPADPYDLQLLPSHYFAGLHKKDLEELQFPTHQDNLSKVNIEYSSVRNIFEAFILLSLLNRYFTFQLLYSPLLLLPTL